MKMYVPRLGDEIILTADWKFTLYNEYRNSALIEFLTMKVDYAQAVACTIPVESILKIDRIYIRKGQNDYDSITFFWKNALGSKKSIRFWAKLDDANTIEFEKYAH